ncbi:DUF2256 domain-containing protein [uncultured Williamsia sp.]|uniref:DUF2256 domain-containing protein n=1 Tax=uncultured Williamsia sp. TaxID=259311 RepID=UPI00262B23AA|nr:DUF2256 domain-containing protein [uncultured Williamsia sp.]
MTDRESKVCEVCGRPFTNRKRWNSRGQWDEVRYCSQACRREARRLRRSGDRPAT